MLKKNVTNRAFSMLLAAAMMLGLAVTSPVQAQTKADSVRNALAAQQQEAELAKAEIIRELPGAQAAKPAPAKAAYMISKKVNYYWDGQDWKENYRNHYKYDKKGRQISHQSIWFDRIWDEKIQDLKEVKHVNETKTTYNKAGYVTKEVTTEDGKESYRHEIKYNSKYQETEYKTYEKGKLLVRQVIKYNKNGSISQVLIYNEKNKLEYTHYHYYDKHGYRTKVVQKNPKGKVIGTTTFKNTYSGGKISKIVEKGDHYTLTIVFYKNGNRKSEKYESKDVKWTYLYYKNGFMKSEETFMENYHSLNKYDSKGNIISALSESEGYKTYTTYKDGWEATEEVTMDGETQKYTFKYKKSSGRVTLQTRYMGKTATDKTEYSYVKIG